MYRKSYCSTPGVGVCVGGSGGVGVDKMLKFYVKCFYVMGKALSGELSCTWTGLVLQALVSVSPLVSD